MFGHQLLSNVRHWRNLRVLDACGANTRFHGNADKRALLPHFKREHCEIISVGPCEPLENYSEILSIAKGDFIFCMSDDDQCVDRAILALPDLIDLSGSDPKVAAMTGTYALETQQGTTIATYKDIDSDDPAARVARRSGARA